jgi:hypothetical protein
MGGLTPHYLKLKNTKIQKKYKKQFQAGAK